METSELKIGRLVQARAGRDKDRYFLLVGIVDRDHVLIADGTYRKVERPKKKKRKHLQDTGLGAFDLGDMLQKGSKPANEQLALVVRQLVEQLVLKE